MCWNMAWMWRLESLQRTGLCREVGRKKEKANPWSQADYQIGRHGEYKICECLSKEREQTS